MTDKRKSRAMPPPAPPSEWDFPKLFYSLNFSVRQAEQASDRVLTIAQDVADKAGDVGADKGTSDVEFYDIKFYPYNPVDSPPVFAIVSERHIFVCRLVPKEGGNPCRVLRVLRDLDEGAANCSCTWAKDPETEAPLLCVAGRDAKIKVYDIRAGTVVRSFVGHGGEINDLATSPANPYLLASASDDATVRFWSLEPVHRAQPCVCVLAGEGHVWNLLSVAFHNSGRYLLSAGHDQVINLWLLPDIPRTPLSTPIIVFYPHFTTSEVHGNLIDCVAFYGDLVLSRSCYEERIVLWRIEGFDSTLTPPTPDQAPAKHELSKDTQSAFVSTYPKATPETGRPGPRPALLTRLLQFATPGCDCLFYLRFSLYNMEGRHATLAFCNGEADIFFWDLQCFGAYRDYVEACARREREYECAQALAAAPDEPDTDRLPMPALEPVPKPSWLPIVTPKKRWGATSTQNQDAAPRKGKFSVEALYNAETLAEWEERYSTNHPHATVKAHKVESVKTLSKIGRQVAWSPDGEWCLVAGSDCRLMVLRR